MSLLSYIAATIKIKKKWRAPKKAMVLIFESGRNLAIEDDLVYLLKPYSVETLPLLHQEINIPIFIKSLFVSGQKSGAYYDTYIRKVSPRLLITYIDNTVEFYSFAIRNSKIKTMFIQNGLRTYFADIFEVLDKKMQGVSLRVDYMLTFGSIVGAEYAKYIEGSVIPIGSFRNNQIPVRGKKIKDTLAYISQFRDTPGYTMNDVFYSFEQFWEGPDRVILPFLRKYADLKSKKLLIIPCMGYQKDPTILEKEKAYYNNILGCLCEFTDWNWHGSSYEAIDLAEVIVSIDSSLGLEAISRGTKTAIFSIRSTMLSLTNPPLFNFGWPGNFPELGPFWTNQPSLESFERILDHLYSVDEAQWIQELQKEKFSDVLRYDPGNVTFKKIIQSELMVDKSLDFQ